MDKETIIIRNTNQIIRNNKLRIIMLLFLIGIIIGLYLSGLYIIMYFELSRDFSFALGFFVMWIVGIVDSIIKYYIDKKEEHPLDIKSPTTFEELKQELKEKIKK